MSSHMVTQIKIWGHSWEGLLLGQLRNSQRAGSSGHSVALVNEKLARSAHVQEHSRESLQLPSNFRRKKCSEPSDGGKICPAYQAVQARSPPHHSLSGSLAPCRASPAEWTSLNSSSLLLPKSLLTKFMLWGLLYVSVLMGEGEGLSWYDSAASCFFPKRAPDTRWSLRPSTPGSSGLSLLTSTCWGWI